LVRLIPRDERFFDLFAEIANRLTTSARLLNQLFAQPEKLDHYVAAIKTVEHEADNITHEVNSKLDTSFVTPLDREDIHALAARLDNVVDLIDGTARRVHMFHIVEVRDPARKLSEVLVKATDCIAASVLEMKKRKAVRKVIAQNAREIKLLEEEGDAIYHDAVGALFLNGADALEVMKWKDVYDHLENALDECEDVANALESISLKNA
jgi:predicted phosphate transport protein (TIGR00153 family)